MHRRDETLAVVGHLQVASSARSLLGHLSRAPSTLFGGQDPAQGREATLTLSLPVGAVRARLSGAAFEDEALGARLSALEPALYAWWWTHVDRVQNLLSAHLGAMPSPDVAWRIARHELVLRHDAKARAAVEDGLALVAEAGATADERLVGDELADVLDLLGQGRLADRVRDALAEA